MTLLRTLRLDTSPVAANALYSLFDHIGRPLSQRALLLFIFN